MRTATIQNITVIEDQLREALKQIEQPNIRALWLQGKYVVLPESRYYLLYPNGEIHEHFHHKGHNGFLKEQLASGAIPFPSMEALREYQSIGEGNWEPKDGDWHCYCHNGKYGKSLDIPNKNNGEIWDSKIHEMGGVYCFPSPEQRSAFIAKNQCVTKDQIYLTEPEEGEVFFSEIYSSPVKWTGSRADLDILTYSHLFRTKPACELYSKITQQRIAKERETLRAGGKLTMENVK